MLITSIYCNIRLSQRVLAGSKSEKQVQNILTPISSSVRMGMLHEAKER